ncbi:MAG: copper-binding protein [Bradyrhizobium sp.]|uniref:copper-binding protein n=1 Tax=Bradyrhizobium sp. TaxID=376 RepID=UPI003D0B7634
MSARHIDEGRNRQVPLALPSNSAKPEDFMKIVQTFGIGSAALALIGSAAFAQESKTGMVTRIDRLNNTIAIQQSQDGTVGASGSSMVKQYKVKGSSLETLHAGDQVSFSASQSGGVETITSIEKKKR